MATGSMPDELALTDSQNRKDSRKPGDENSKKALVDESKTQVAPRKWTRVSIWRADEECKHRLRFPDPNQNALNNARSCPRTVGHQL